MLETTYAEFQLQKWLRLNIWLGFEVRHILSIYICVSTSCIGTEFIKDYYTNNIVLNMKWCILISVLVRLQTTSFRTNFISFLCSQLNLSSFFSCLWTINQPLLASLKPEASLKNFYGPNPNLFCLSFYCEHSNVWIWLYWHKQRGKVPPLHSSPYRQQTVLPQLSISITSELPDISFTVVQIW